MSTDFERQAGPIAVGPMVGLGAGCAALTVLGASPLFEFALKLLNLGTPGVLVLNGRRGDWVWMVGDQPGNVAVCGDSLEQVHAKGQCLAFDIDPLVQALGRPIDLAQADQPIVLGMLVM